MTCIILLSQKTPKKGHPSSALVHEPASSSPTPPSSRRGGLFSPHGPSWQIWTPPRWCSMGGTTSSVGVSHSLTPGAPLTSTQPREHARSFSMRVDNDDLLWRADIAACRANGIAWACSATWQNNTGKEWTRRLENRAAALCVCAQCVCYSITKLYARMGLWYEKDGQWRKLLDTTLRAFLPRTSRLIWIRMYSHISLGILNYVQNIRFLVKFISYQVKDKLGIPLEFLARFEWDLWVYSMVSKKKPSLFFTLWESQVSFRKSKKSIIYPIILCS